MASFDGQGNSRLDLQQHLQSAGNRLCFALRQFLRQPKRLYSQTPEDKTALIKAWRSQGEQAATQEEGRLFQRFEALRQRYELSGLIKNSSLERFCECLTYLDYLDQLQAQHFFLEKKTFASIYLDPDSMAPCWLDVGAKNWAYAEVLHCFFSQHIFLSSPPVATPPQIVGIELDANRRYVDGFSRQDYAEAYIGDFPNMTYLAGDVLADFTALRPQSFDVVSSFLPFIVPEPLLAWGLPMDYFQPEAILKRCLSLLKPEGTLIIFNQGEQEAQLQVNLLCQLQLEQKQLENKTITWIDCGALPASFLQYRYPRYAYLVKVISE